MSDTPTPKKDAGDAAAAKPERRGRPRLGHLGTIGVLFAFLGFVLVFRVTPAMPPDDIALVIGLGDGAPRLVLDPANLVLLIGIVFIVAGIVAVFERWTGRYAKVALVISAILFAPLVLVAAVGLSGQPQTNILPLVVESLRQGTPIALGALAGLWCERSGVVNIGIEGMMLTAACVGFIAYAVFGGGQDAAWLWLSVLIAVAAGGLMALLHAGLSVSFRTDQIVSGVAINLLAIGMTSFLRREVLLPTGVNAATTLPEISIPGLSSIPIIGEELFSGKPIYLAMYVLYILSTVVLFRTRWGLRVRSVGEHPHAAETLGVNVIKIRYQAVVLGGLIAGLGGAWFSLETVGTFNNLMTGGTGFIALAAMIFGKWRPWSTLAGAMLFGFASALGTRVQLLNVEVGGYPVPSQFLQVLPYVVTIIVLAGAIGRAIPPAADGVPYERSR